MYAPTTTKSPQKANDPAKDKFRLTPPLVERSMQTIDIFDNISVNSIRIRLPISSSGNGGK